MIKKIKELFLKKNPKDNLKSLELFFGKNLISENYAKDDFMAQLLKLLKFIKRVFI